jgi:RNA polymerase-binding transcription factor
MASTADAGRDQHPAGSSSAARAIDPARARARLQEERARVERLVRDLRSNVTDHEDEADAQPTAFDPADTASDTTQRTGDLSILESLEAELAEIDAAMVRVDDGTYGTDEVTGEPIDPARLEAVPTARTNVSNRER